MADVERRATRAEKAAATRRRMVAAARDRFVEHGYQATTMQTIADLAGVAVQTLYFTFGTKRTILSEVIDAAVAGDEGPVATLDQPWVADALAASPREMLGRVVERTGAIHARVAPVLEVVRSAAASDPEIAALWRANTDQRRTVLATFAGALAGRTALRRGIGPGRAADIALATLAPETYRLLTVDHRWTTDQWADWAHDALVRQLLPD